MIYPIFVPSSHLTLNSTHLKLSSSFSSTKPLWSLQHRFYLIIVTYISDKVIYNMWWKTIWLLLLHCERHGHSSPIDESGNVWTCAYKPSIGRTDEKIDWQMDAQKDRQLRGGQTEKWLDWRTEREQMKEWNGDENNYQAKIKMNGWQNWRTSSNYWHNEYVTDKAVLINYFLIPDNYLCRWIWHIYKASTRMETYYSTEITRIKILHTGCLIQGASYRVPHTGCLIQ